MIDAYKKLWTKAFDFRGRSTRHDYWWGALANLLVSYVLLALGKFVSEAFSGIYFQIPVTPETSNIFQFNTP